MEKTNYQSIVYSVDSKNKLGTGIFLVGDEIKTYCAHKFDELKLVLEGKAPSTPLVQSVVYLDREIRTVAFDRFFAYSQPKTHTPRQDNRCRYVSVLYHLPQERTGWVGYFVGKRK